ncbi:nitrate- and nitrite sensing domain-containing protein [Streptomyces varsoviensis]|nr:nitrate- and nitrite sensing domain-containing protein [Streptomyces varsoviensis]
MQGRFKRDGNAAAEPEPRGSTDRGAAGAAADAPSGGEPSERPKAKKQTGPGPRVALRNWRISTRLVSLLALPVVAATTLGALRIQDSLEKIDQLDHMKLLTEMTQQATRLADALQEERDKSAGPLTGGQKKDDQGVIAPRLGTDRAIAAFKQATDKVKPEDPSMVGVRTTLVDISKQLDKIKDIRAGAYDDKEYISRTVGNYDALITSLLSLSQDMAQATSNPEMITSTRALATFSSAKEYASIQRAVLSAALANPSKGPHLSENDRQYGKSALESEDEALRRFTAIRSGASTEELMRALNGGQTEITTANANAERWLGKQDGVKSEKTSYQDWYDQDSVKLEEMSKIEQTLLTQMDQKARELRADAQQDAILNSALIVLVLGISLVGAFVVARSMVRSLRRLQDTAQTVAQERLPELVKQLSEIDPQDVDTSVESVGVHSRDEIGKVAAAFDDVHREAVRLASEQAMLRGNVNAMFTNLSRRSQGLIQRQLSLISELESREADPDQLSSLFKLDHLATRMRRNGENLLVLAGEEPGRRWTRPVPLVDVLRAAASEVEQYERIELSGVPPTEVAGRVVNDLVHLLAELLENATSFSSPQTKVKVTGHALPDGRVLVEIHDTGIGLSPEDLAAINERLASPPTVDVSVSRRMGLFVVGRLSLRHGIRIQLRPSDSGGTTALVMLPVDVAQGGKKPVPSNAPGGSAPGAPGGNPNAGPGLVDSAPPRRQMPGPGSRPALPGKGGQGGQAGQAGQGGLPGRPGQGGPGAGPGDQSGRPGTTESGLPTRPVGAGLAPAAPPSGGASLFDSGAPRPAGTERMSTRPDGRPAIQPRGKGPGPSVAPPTGAPGSGDRARRPQLPPRGPAGELSGGPADGLAGRSSRQPATSWGSDNEQRPGSGSPVDDWPLAEDGSPRGRQDSPRGHEDVDAPSAFNRLGTRDTDGAGAPLAGPGDTGGFTRPGSGGPRGPQDSGQFAQPGQGGRGDTGQFPRLGQGGDSLGETSQFPSIGGPGDTGEFAQPGTGARNDTGEYTQPGRDALGDTGPYAQPDQGGDRADTGRFAQLGQGGNDLGETSQFPRIGGPGDTGEFAQPGTGARNDTGEYAQPGRDALGDTGSYAQPGQDGRNDTGQFARPGQGGNDPGETSQFPSIGGPGDTGEFAQPGTGVRNDTGEFAQPGTGARNDTGEFAQPGPDALGDTGQFPRGPLPTRGGQPGGAQHMGAPTQEGALPPAGPGDGRTPLFDTLESDWFSGPREDAAGSVPSQPTPQAPAPAPGLPRREPQAALQQPAPGQDQGRPQGQGGPGLEPVAPADGWRSSPNDERWRRAEQIREPAAGGITSSGLPRRVPRANLVEGTAQQQSHPAGPQVSRAPDDVRGRLTNLRRGIQQGRQAGSGQTTGNHGIDPNYQQER